MVWQYHAQTNIQSLISPNYHIYPSIRWDFCCWCNSSSDNWGSPYNHAKIWTLSVNVFSWKLKVVKVFEWTGKIFYKWNTYIFCLCKPDTWVLEPPFPQLSPPPHTHTHKVTKIKSIYNTLFPHSIVLSSKSCKSCQKQWMILVLDCVTLSDLSVIM
jgi:hypothetical protein